MTPWLPVPRALLTDPALSMLSLAAQAVVLRLALAAVDGALPIPAGRIGADVAEVVCARTPGVRESYAEAVAAGVVAERAGAVLLPWEWPILGSERASGVPGGGDDGDARKRLRALFSKHHLSTTQARTEWLSTSRGQAALDRLKIDVGAALLVAEGAGRRGGRFGLDRPARKQPEATGGAATEATDGSNRRQPTAATTEATVASNHGSNHALPPHTPLSEKREKEDKSECESARTHGGNPNEQPGATDGSNRDGSNRAPSVRCATEETVGLDPLQALSDLRERSKGRILGGTDSRSMAAWHALVRDLAAQPGSAATTLAAYRTLGDWIAAGGLGWMTRAKPSLTWLLAAGRLAEQLEAAAGWDRAGRPPIDHQNASQTPARAPSPAAPTRSRRLGPAPCSTPAEFEADASAPDPLFAMLEGTAS